MTVFRRPVYTLLLSDYILTGVYQKVWYQFIGIYHWDICCIFCTVFLLCGVKPGYGMLLSPLYLLALTVPLQQNILAMLLAPSNLWYHYYYRCCSTVQFIHSWWHATLLKFRCHWHRNLHPLKPDV